MLFFVLADFTLAVVLADVTTRFTAVAGSLMGWAMMLVAAADGLVVQYQTPFASAQAWPSGAESYESDCATTAPEPSSRAAWPLVLLMLKPVSLT